MRLIVGIRIVGIHIFDGTKNSLWIERIIVLHDMIPDHDIKKWPTDIVIWRQSLVLI